MDRPSRKTKVVSYCEAKDFDDDEDFACVKVPPSKKAREDMKQEQKKPSNKSSSKETNSHSLQNEKRKPLDAKLYERDLEAAITLSLLNNTDRFNEHPPPSKDVEVRIPIDENIDPTSQHLSNCSVDSAVMGLDEITPEKESPASVKQRKGSSKAVEVLKKGDEDEDYTPKLTPDSESDDNYSEPAESEDEEFTVKKVSKTKKKEKVTKKDKTKPSPVAKKEKQPSKASKSKSQAAAAFTSGPSKVASTRPSSSCSTSTSKPAASLSPAGGKVPKWNPPAQIGKSPTSSQSAAVKSPGQGLRLGLSRLVRVKPLHPSVTSH